MGLAEEANNRPFALPWVRSLLDNADALRREAEVLILPEAFGFASGAQITKAWRGVRDAYAFVDICYRRIRDARRELDRARITLSAYIPYLEATGSAEREAVWLETAQTAVELDRLLRRPSGSDETPGAVQGRLEQLNSDLDDLTKKLQTHLTDLQRPFEPDLIHGLVRSTEENTPAPSPGP